MNRVLISCFLFLSLRARAQDLIHRAPVNAASRPAPFQADDHHVRAGAKLFARECAACHGTGGKGGVSAPPLTLPAIYAASPGTVFWVLKNGSLRRGMPSFAQVPEPQRWQIVAYLQSQR